MHRAFGSTYLSLFHLPALSNSRGAGCHSSLLFSLVPISPNTRGFFQCRQSLWTALAGTRCAPRLQWGAVLRANSGENGLRVGGPSVPEQLGDHLWSKRALCPRSWASHTTCPLSETRVMAPQFGMLCKFGSRKFWEGIRQHIARTAIKRKERILSYFFLTQNLFVGFSQLGFFFKIREKEGKEGKPSHAFKQNLHPTALIFFFLKLQLSNKSSPVAKIKRVGWGKFIR